MDLDIRREELVTAVPAEQCCGWEMEAFEISCYRRFLPHAEKHVR